VDLDEPVQAAGIINGGFLSGFHKSTKQSGRNVSKGCINSNVCKDSYNEAIENGYTTSEASVITELYCCYVESYQHALIS
jgi:hypothetical protein